MTAPYYADADVTLCGSPLRLTIKRGPHSGTTAIMCTCGWDRTYPTVAGARRALGQHIKTLRSHLRRQGRETGMVTPTRIPRYQPTEPPWWARLANLGRVATLVVGAVVLAGGAWVWIWLAGGVR